MNAAFVCRVALGGLLLAMSCAAHAQDDAGDVTVDGGGREILESIYVPEIPNAPFSLKLTTEWKRAMNNSGSFTLANTRPIMRDRAGRLYEERWLLVPKGGTVKSRMSWIQIADPNAHTLLECGAIHHVCQLEDYDPKPVLHDPGAVTSGTLKGGKGTHTHEDLGAQFVAGVPAHEYRETTVLNPGVAGNDLPMTSVRDFRYSAELGFNLTSVYDSPQHGRQSFVVSEITRTDPDPKFFEVPAGYTVVDERKHVAEKP